MKKLNKSAIGHAEAKMLLVGKKGKNKHSSLGK
jgi:hypothetical protein